jgi:hypothetical protein
MKRSLVLLACVGIAGVALAQPPQMHHPAWGGAGWNTRQMRMEMRLMQRWRMHQLTVLLQLTPAQRQQVKSIFRQQRVAMRRNMEAMHRSMRPIRREMRAVMRKMRAEQRAARHAAMAQLAHVLSPGQMTKFKVLMPPPGMMRMGPGAMGGMMPHRAWNAPPPPPPVGH